ncbi:restriction endonuclease [uncultured Clostridium sp.]|jgi:restriction system protein|uniref:restriction endonuclease n=1 Tax=uncultured Clostridium sp. TaxID=59620 RepID=UPI0026261A2A|nr:restriction endonuclease [uncultured Clostridium sp.]
MYFIIGVIIFSGIIFLLAIRDIKQCSKYEQTRTNERRNNVHNSLRKTEEKKSTLNYDNRSIYDISKGIKFNLNPRQFEIFCSLLFKELGYEVELTQYQYDGGKDIILDKHIIVECKKFITQQVGREICQKLIGAMVQNKADEAIVLNTGLFNANARQYAREVDSITLLGLGDISHMLDKIGLKKANYIYQRTLDNK